MPEVWNYGATEPCCEQRNDRFMEKRNYGSSKPLKYGSAKRGDADTRKAEESDTRIFDNPCKTVDDGRGEEGCSGFGVEL